MAPSAKIPASVSLGVRPRGEFTERALQTCREAGVVQGTPRDHESAPGRDDHAGASHRGPRLRDAREGDDDARASLCLAVLRQLSRDNREPCGLSHAEAELLVESDRPGVVAEDVQEYAF